MIARRRRRPVRTVLTAAALFVSVVTIGVVASLSTWIAIRLAASIASRLGSRVEVVAGAVLIGLGVDVLLKHLGSP